MPGLLVIMGSGETAPTMVKPHRTIFERVGDRPAALLDTTYGFQSNAEDISTRAVSYFAASVGRQVGVISWRAVPPAGLARERALAALRAAGWVFAGPGSPTYALRHWRDTPIPGELADVLGRDGVVLFASAAALTLGSHTVPVYEIYKAGLDPHWVPGLDLVRQVTGLPAVVIPHYNNAEGGHHDTRFCYLGEPRLSMMEASLPLGSFVLGVDEHTAVLLDLTDRTATVVGNGVMTVRRQGRSVIYPAGGAVGFAALAAGARGTAVDHGPDTGAGAAARNGVLMEAAASLAGGDPGRSGSGHPAATTGRGNPTSLRGAAEELAGRFDTALRERDIDRCVTTILDLEQVLLDWSADTLTSDEGDYARGRLRTMVLGLGGFAVLGARDPREVIGSFVDNLLELRRRARDARDFTTSDWVRDRLAAAGVEVRDTRDGSEWHLTQRG